MLSKIRLHVSSRNGFWSAFLCTFKTVHGANLFTFNNIHKDSQAYEYYRCCFVWFKLQVPKVGSLGCKTISKLIIETGPGRRPGISGLHLEIWVTRCVRVCRKNKDGSRLSWINIFDNSELKCICPIKPKITRSVDLIYQLISVLRAINLYIFYFPLSRERSKRV